MYRNNQTQLWVHLVTQSCVSLGLFPRNFCIKRIFIQSIDELIIFDITKAVKLTYTVLSSASSTAAPISFNSNKTAVFPYPTSFKLSDDGFNYIVRNIFKTNNINSDKIFLFR